jgi:LmbE family N-acetylglucosaminyl deacetylase
VFGAHCDDPESAAGGLIALLTRSGHEVICAYATSFRGDRKFFGRPEAEVRQAESTAACKILGATTKFFPYAHEKLVADEATVKEVSAWFDEIKPDIVVTHWPLDTHPNHHATSSIVWQCYQRSGGWNLYFFEVETGTQSLAFYPELYLDISPVHDIKQEGNLCFKSQNPETTFWPMHEQMQRDRGVQCGVPWAEAYMLVEAKPGGALLPVPFLPKRR